MFRIFWCDGREIVMVWDGPRMSQVWWELQRVAGMILQYLSKVGHPYNTHRFNLILDSRTPLFLGLCFWLSGILFNNSPSHSPRSIPSLPLSIRCTWHRRCWSPWLSKQARRHRRKTWRCQNFLVFLMGFGLGWDWRKDSPIKIKGFTCILQMMSYSGYD
jgi:hypothetical protein